jgi:rusticyanin
LEGSKNRSPSKHENPFSDRRSALFLLVLLLLVLIPIGVYLTNDINTANSRDACNCFDGNPFVPSPINNGTSQMNLKLANYTAMNGTIPSYATVDRQTDTITFRSMNISILAFGNSNAWVSAITNMTIPAYDNVSTLSNAFAIYRLFEPTLIIPKGATINVTFVDMDYTDHHNFVISTFPPPFPMFIMANMVTGGEMVQMTPLLPPVNNSTQTASLYQYTIVLNLPYSIDRMWYMCMFPNHAMNGMYGNITLVDPGTLGI